MNFYKEKSLSLTKKELHFLYQFRKARCIDEFITSDVWKLFLSENPKYTIKRMYEFDLLRRSSYTEYIDYRCTVERLKKYLKNKGLQVSGKKAILIDRIVNNDPDGIREKLGQNRTIQCTDKGKKVVNEYIKSEKSRKENAESGFIKCVKAKKFKEALTIVDKYHEETVYHLDPKCLEDQGKSLGFDKIFIGERSDEERIIILEKIFSSEPKIVKKLGIHNLEPYRINACMQEFWGNLYDRDLIDDLKPVFDYYPDVISRMILFYISHQHELEEYKRINVQEVTILTTGEASCEACRMLEGKKFNINTAIELPYEMCINKKGCRCSFISVNESIENSQP